VIPGSQIPFTKDADKDKTSVDIIGQVNDDKGIPFGTARETVKLNLDASQEVRRKNVQYNTAFILPHGNYKMKFVVRENQTGRLGSFETELTVPDLSKSPLKISSVVLGNQRIPASGKKGAQNPLQRDGMELVQNVLHVFRTDQHLYLQYEVYDPGKRKETIATTARAGNASAAQQPPAQSQPQTVRMRVLTSLLFLQGNKKVYETKPLEATELTDPSRKAVVFQIELPLDAFPAGVYSCQVNIVDDAAGSFAFPRTTILVKSPQSAPGAATGGK